jgi:type II secretory pathway component PulF
MNPSESLALFQGLHSLLTAGLSLVTALELQQSEHRGQAWALGQIILNLREGQRFSQSLSRHLNLPHLIYVYIRLGENSGNLAQACGLCVAWLQRQQTWKRMLWQISFYPCLLIITSMGLLFVMLGFVLPEFASLYRVLNVTLPPSTAWLLQFAQQAPELVQTILFIVPALVLGLALTWRTNAGRYSFELFLLRLPGVKRLFSHHYEFQLALQLGTLLQGACPLLEALDFMRLGASSPLYKDYLKTAQQKIREGQNLRQSFCHGLICSPTFTALISHAQQTGHLDTVLLNLATQHSELFLHWQDRAKHLIQPCITLVMGGFLGFWILLLYYPMLQLGTNLG